LNNNNFRYYSGKYRKYSGK